jgi:hypothetical protein
MHSATGTGDTVVTGGVCVRYAGGVLVPAGSADCVVHPVTDITTMQMIRRMITFGSIKKPSLHDIINKTLTAGNFGPYGNCPAGPDQHTRDLVSGAFCTPPDWIPEKFL